MTMPWFFMNTHTQPIKETLQLIKLTALTLVNYQHNKP
jgi:hypothetical protein